MKSFVAWLVIFGTLAAPAAAWAQADDFSLERMPDDLKSQSAYRKINPLPLAYVSDLTAAVSPSGIVTGSFVASSGEVGGLGDLQYEIYLLQALPKAEPNAFLIDDGAVYDRLLVKQPFSLLAQEKKTVAFTYRPPAVPSGTYRLRIQLVTSNDRKLGWGDTPLQLQGDGMFAVLDTEAVLVQSVDPITHETRNAWQSLEGPNVAPQDPLSLKLFATNAGTLPLTGTVMIETERILMADSKLSQQTGQAVTLAAKESRAVTIPITAAADPGAYRVLVSLVDGTGQRVSGIGEFRYVVQGLSASIVSQTVASLPAKKGQTAEIHFTVAGSADRVTPVNGILEISLTDNKGELGKVENTVSIPGATPVQGVAAISLLHNRCGVPSVTATLRTKDGHSLDTYTAAYPDLETKTCGLAALLGNTTLLVALGVLVAAVIILLVIMGLRAKQQPPTIGSGTIVGALLLCVVLVLGLHTTPRVEANGLQFIFHHDDPNNPNEQVRPELYVAYPTQNSEITSLSVPYAARFSWISCDNAIAAGWLRVYMKATPGKVDWFAGSDWIQAPFAKYVEIPRTCSCDSRPRRVADLSGTLQLPDMPAGSTTTIWTSGNSQGSWRGGALIHDFTWLTLKPATGASAGTSGTAGGGSDNNQTVPDGTAGGGAGGGSGSGSNGAGGAGASQTSVAGVDAAIAISAPDSVEKGSLLNYSVSVHNNGTDEAKAVVASVDIPANLAFNAANSSGACSQQSGQVKCNLGNLPPGQTSPLAVVFAVGNGAACNSKVKTAANVTTTSEDKNPANNSATSNETTITCGQCRDKVDNDSDGRIDEADPACHVANDLQKAYDPSRKTEQDTQCTDVKDNDADSFVDANDAGCHKDNDLNKEYVPADNSEAVNTQFDPGGFKVVE